jgi:hypothetical protein
MPQRKSSGNRAAEIAEAEMEPGMASGVAWVIELAGDGLCDWAARARAGSHAEPAAAREVWRKWRRSIGSHYTPSRRPQ